MPVKVKPPISLAQLQRIDRAIYRLERSRRVYGSGHVSVRQELSDALGIAPAQLSRVFSEQRVPVAWADATAFVRDVLAALEALD